MTKSGSLFFLVAFGFSTSACAAQTKDVQFCANGSISIDESGNVTRASFREAKPSTNDSDRTKLANAVLVGRPVWLSVMFEVGAQNKRLWVVNGVTISNARTITAQEPIVVSAFSAPKSIFVGPELHPADRLPSSQMLTVVVESTGRMFVDSISPVQLRSATWCIG